MTDRVDDMTTEALEAEFNALGCALADGPVPPRMNEIEAELRERFGVISAAAAVVGRNTR